MTARMPFVAYVGLPLYPSSKVGADVIRRGRHLGLSFGFAAMTRFSDASRICLLTIICRVDTLKSDSCRS